MKQITNIWQQLTGGAKDGRGKMSGRDKLMLLVLTGILLLVIAWPVSENHSQKEASKTSSSENVEPVDATDAYTKNMEQRLTAILENIDGAGRVQVMITLKSTAEQVIEKDDTYSESRSTSGESGDDGVISDSVSRSESTVYNSASGGSPYVIKELQPEIEGVLVVAEGADHESTLNEITYAVQVLFDVPVHKIKVVKMSSRQEGSY